MNPNIPKAMNEVYSTVLPAGAKPARAAYQVGNLPVDGIRVEIEAIGAFLCNLLTWPILSRNNSRDALI